MTAWAIEALLASAVLIALVLLVRVPVRRAFGPTIAYALWAIPALRLALPPLPAHWLGETPAPLASAGEVLLLVLPTSAALPEAAPPLLGMTLVAAWGVGALLFLGWQVVAYRRFTRRVAASGQTLGRVGRIALVVSDAVADPLAYGLVRPVVAVPRDFHARYDGGERRLALAHEVAHHARGDMVANWVALLVLAIHWFNPLAWAAFRAFRADQEMANDACVLAGRAPEDRHAYGCTLAKAAGVRLIHAPAAACGLNTITDLKGRLRMLAISPSRTRRIAGAATIAGATLALLGFTASGSDAAERARAQVEQATGVPLAALAPGTLMQAAPPAPPAPPGPTAPGSGGRHVATQRDRTSVHVTVTENGRTHQYAGAEAEAWLAAHPQPVPPVPPIPPVPPVPPIAAARAEAQAARVEAQAARIEAQADRIEATGRHAAAASRHARLASLDSLSLRRDAQTRALDGLRRVRVAWASGDGPAALAGERREGALRGIDSAIASLEKQVAERD